MAFVTKNYYAFTECCTFKGRILSREQEEKYRAGTEDQSEDIFLAYSGTESAVLAEATEDVRNANLPGFRRKVARNIVALLRFLPGARE